MASHVIKVTPVVDTSAYANGDQISTLITLEGVNNAGKEECVLRQITLIDQDEDDDALDVIVFDSSITPISGDNDALNVSDDDVANYILGSLEIASADYIDVAGTSVARITPNLYCKPSADGKLYVLLVARAAQTKTAADDLTLKFHFEF